MLDVGRRSKRLTKKRTSRRTARRPLTGSNYDTTAQAAGFTIQGRGTAFPLDRILQRRLRGRSRRSRARLGQHGAPAAARETRVLAPARPVVRISVRVMLNIAVLGLLGWLLIWFFVSNRFYVNAVVVEGNRRVSTEAILQTSGIQGYSIFWINAAQVAADISKSLPPIKHVRVRHALPNLVTLIVEEQGEEVMWVVSGNRYWVDEEGRFHPTQGGDDPKLLVRDIRPGLPSEVDVDALVAAQQLTWLAPELRSIEYGAIQGLQFTHPQGWVVYLGTGDDMPKKLNVLRALEQRLSAEGVRQPSLIDIRFPDYPYYRYPDE